MWGCALGLKFNLASGTLHAEEGGVGGGHKALDAAGDLELVVSCLQVPSLSFGRNMIGSTAGCCVRSVHAPHISPVCLLHSALLQKQHFPKEGYFFECECEQIMHQDTFGHLFMKAYKHVLHSFMTCCTMEGKKAKK